MVGQSVTEKTFQKTVSAKARKLGIFVCKMEAVGQRGFPDLLLMYGGRSLYLELKSPKGTGKLSPLQERMQADMRAVGGWVEVAQDMDTIDSLLQKLIG